MKRSLKVRAFTKTLAVCKVIGPYFYMQFLADDVSTSEAIRVEAKTCPLPNNGADSFSADNSASSVRNADLKDTVSRGRSREAFHRIELQTF
jgi:hypothetical protein